MRRPLPKINFDPNTMTPIKGNNPPRIQISPLAPPSRRGGIADRISPPSRLDPFGFQMQIPTPPGGLRGLLPQQIPGNQVTLEDGTVIEMGGKSAESTELKDMIAKYLATQPFNNAEYREDYDTNQDGKITLQDAVYAGQFAAGLRDPNTLQPIEQAPQPIPQAPEVIPPAPQPIEQLPPPNKLPPSDIVQRPPDDFFDYMRSCPSPEEHIQLANNDWILAGELKVGDEVVTSKEPQKVTYAKRIENSPRREVLFTEGDSIVTSPSHPYFVKDKGFVDVEDLKEGDEIGDLVVSEVKPFSDGPVIHISVDKVETYVLRGGTEENPVPALSHNKSLPAPEDRGFTPKPGDDRRTPRVRNPFLDAVDDRGVPIFGGKDTIGGRLGLSIPVPSVPPLDPASDDFPPIMEPPVFDVEIDPIPVPSVPPLDPGPYDYEEPIPVPSVPPLDPIDLGPSIPVPSVPPIMEPPVFGVAPLRPLPIPVPSVPPPFAVDPIPDPITGDRYPLPEGVDPGGNYFIDPITGDPMYQPPMPTLAPGELGASVMPTPINLKTGKPRDMSFIPSEPTQPAVPAPKVIPPVSPPAVPAPKVIPPVSPPAVPAPEVIPPAETTPPPDTAPVTTETAPATGSVAQAPGPYAAGVKQVATKLDPLTEQLLFGIGGKGGFIPGAMRASEKVFYDDQGNPIVIDEKVAGFSPDQLAAMQMQRQSVGMQDPYLQQAAGAYGAGTQALEEGLQKGRTAAIGSLAATRGGVGALRRGLGESADILRGTIGGYDPSMTDRFYDPYEDRVVQQTISDIMERGAQGDIAARAGDIARGGESAFGSRARLGASERQEALGRGLAEAVSGIRSRGFSEAQRTGLGEFARQRAAERAASAGLAGLAGQGFGGSQALAGALSGLGGTEQQIGQQRYSGQFGLGSSLQGLGAQAAGASASDIAALYGMGGQQQGQAQRMLDAQRRNLQQRQMTPLLQYQALQPFVSMAPAGQFQTITDFAPPPSATQIGIGTGLSTFGALGNLYGSGKT